MELLSYAQAPRSRDPVRTHVQRLIEVVGTPRFEGEFVKALGAARQPLADEPGVIRVTLRVRDLPATTRDI